VKNAKGTKPLGIPKGTAKARRWLSCLATNKNQCRKESNEQAQADENNISVHILWKIYRLPLEVKMVLKWLQLLCV